jgi:hypothetical protein
MPSKNALFYRGVVRFSILPDVPAQDTIATTVLSGVFLTSKKECDLYFYASEPHS